MEILIVDDEHDMYPLVSMVFRPMPVRYVDAWTQVLPMLADHPEIECVLLDISLPGKNGIDLLREIHTQYPFLPVLMFTAHDDMANIRKSMQSGAFDFLTKPIDIADLRTSVLHAINHARRARTMADSMKKTESVLHEAIRILTEGMRVTTQIKQSTPEGDD